MKYRPPQAESENTVSADLNVFHELDSLRIIHE
jgi:hypothetical protein